MTEIMDEKPLHYEIDPRDERTELRNNLIKALRALPHYFSSPINIEGLVATDLFSMNTLLGGAIEEQTVRILNTLRATWDKESRWYDCEFIRFPESFPDVRLVRSVNDPDPVIGIELKGWYLLSKENQPSFRYKASSDATTVYDLIVCYPWALSNVLSGNPLVYEPYIEQAKYAADMRTYYWQHRKGKVIGRSVEIIHPETGPYPRAGSQYIDTPVKDSGNFGRIARVPGLMDEWCDEALNIKLAGIEARYWIAFFNAFAEGNTVERIRNEITKIEAQVKASTPQMADEARTELLEHIWALLSIEALI